MSQCHCIVNISSQPLKFEERNKLIIQLVATITSILVSYYFTVFSPTLEFITVGKTSV